MLQFEHVGLSGGFPIIFVYFHCKIATREITWFLSIHLHSGNLLLAHFPLKKLQLLLKPSQRPAGNDPKSEVTVLHRMHFLYFTGEKTFVSIFN